MKWMPETESWAGRDKLWHFLGGFAITGVTAIVVHTLGFKPESSALAGFWAACTVGIAKEVRDASGFGTPSARDALATVAGGILCMGLLRWAL